ncbi:unnamed protein product [Orchesella dallaii]|uniref:SITS-binding protein n=1 Tax=Orchesella dallaii TaxID=48710 RepID=A0ABP1PLH6_9HEXA
MKARWSLYSLSFCLALLGSGCVSAEKARKSGKTFLKVENPSNHRAASNAIQVGIGPSVETYITGYLGLNLPESIGVSTACDDYPEDDFCHQWGDYAKLHITEEEEVEGCGRIEWTSAHARKLVDCYDIDDGDHWYGGGETYSQRWPIEVQSRAESPFITGDHLNNGSYYAGGVLEKYWLVSKGVALFVDDDTPLYFSLKSEAPGQLCLSAKDDHPYTIRSPLTLKYSYCVGSNILETHKKIQTKFFRTPTSIPDERMLVRPLWSTWAQYHSSVNQSIVLDFARRVVSEGFTMSSHIEIDDKWEACYGDETFDPAKFPDAKAMIDEIKGMDLNVTVWAHPFVNYDCPLFNEGMSRGYFVKDLKGKTGLGSWWAGSTAGVIDVTNPEAVQWWQDRLRKLQQDTGVDSFKFDAGETNWLPYHFTAASGNDANLLPNLYTTKFVEACSEFGGLIETRAAHRNHDKGIFIRMMDKDSTWGYGNGLKSMIPTLLHFGLLGYPFVLPDMIGGNAYGGRPSKELYVRWMQANVLMPAVQISIVPWDFDQETVELTKAVLDIRNGLAEEILAAARQATVDGSPLNKPLWWIAPQDAETYVIDDEYTLGDDIIVAPVLEEGATSRNIYLPQGTWSSYPDNESYIGPIWIMDYPAPLNKVPIFAKISN